MPDELDELERFEKQLPLLQLLHRLSAEIDRVEDSKFPDPEAYGADVRNYQLGWNAAVDFMVDEGKERFKEGFKLLA